MADVTVSRTGVRGGVVRNASGAEVRYGDDGTDGAFTPGELLAAALAACQLMSVDHVLRRRLGDDVAATATAALTHTDDRRFGSAQVRLLLELGDLDEPARTALATVVARAADRVCTVSRTLDAGLPHTLEVVPDGESTGVPGPGVGGAS